MGSIFPIILTKHASYLQGRKGYCSILEENGKSLIQTLMGVEELEAGKIKWLLRRTGNLADV